ncbi:MAG: hypothetical protein Q8934_08930 [Bacillota bacterium]|nr:hypothetical protein [Bacillota bacterium]
MYQVEDIIRYLLWFMFFIGLWLVIYPLITPNLKGLKLKKILMKNIQKKPLIYRKIEKLLLQTTNWKGDFAVYTFIFILILIGVISLVGFLKSGQTIITSILLSVIASIMPVLFLYFRLRQQRIRTSHEGQFMVTELLNNYRIFHNNISEALDHTILTLTEHPNSKKVLSQLAIGLKDYQNENELQTLIKDFKESINTTWSEPLGALIQNASFHGDDITEGLIDITNELKVLEQLKEKNKQNNIEGLMLLQFLIPLFIIGSYYALINWFGFTIKKLIDYQFFNSMGFTTFYFTMLFVAVTFLVSLYLKHEKNDY